MSEWKSRISTVLVLGLIGCAAWYFLQWRQSQLIKKNPELHAIYQALPEQVNSIILYPETALYPTFSEFIGQCRWNSVEGLYEIESWVKTDDGLGVMQSMPYKAQVRMYGDSPAIVITERPATRGMAR